MSETNSHNRHWRRGSLVAGGVMIAAVVVLLAAFERGSLGASDPASPAVVPCYVVGSPVAREASPILHGCKPVTVGTPLAADGLMVTLTLSSNEAAPQNVVIDVRDANGTPVDDATVTIINRHLEMDHGDFVHTLDHVGQGRYEAKGVGMGMGGRWQTEVVIERPGQPTVTVYFLEKLEGLQ